VGHVDPCTLSLSGLHWTPINTNLTLLFPASRRCFCSTYSFLRACRPYTRRVSHTPRFTAHPTPTSSLPRAPVPAYPVLFLFPTSSMWEPIWTEGLASKFHSISILFQVFVCHLFCSFSTSFWFLVWLTLQPWRWRRHVPRKRRLSFTGLRGVICQRHNSSWYSNILINNSKMLN
jgi:hypothetical protein